jgi:hypothetical protein
MSLPTTNDAVEEVQASRFGVLTSMVAKLKENATKAFSQVSPLLPNRVRTPRSSKISVQLQCLVSPALTS